MPKFRVIAHSTIGHVFEIEAENQQEAWTVACEKSDEELKEARNGSYFYDIDHIEELDAD